MIGQIVALAINLVFVNDTTVLSAQLSPELRNWTRELRGKGGVPCCDDADGIDPIWDISGGNYRVFYRGEWLTVDPDALLTQKNRLGIARAWVGWVDGKPFVRCFLPGPTI